MQSFQALAKPDLEAVDRLIFENLNSNVALVEHIGEYLVEAGGKRLRPLLSLTCTRALNGDIEPSQCLATAVEFIHTATLLHDDVVDDSSMRRGRSTANEKWGNAAPVLVGDFVYSRAFQLLVSIGDLEVLRILSETTNILAEGEVLQLVNAGNPDTPEDDYYQTIRSKTARLFEAACEGAAVLANASDAQRKALATYGDKLGIAFQLVDDLLDYVGDAQTMGKNVGDDLSEGKATLPLIHAMREGDKQAKDVIRKALSDKDASHINDVIEAVRNSGSLDYTKKAAQQAIVEAKAALQYIQESPYRDALDEIADYCIARTL